MKAGKKLLSVFLTLLLLLGMMPLQGVVYAAEGSNEVFAEEQATEESPALAAERDALTDDKAEDNIRDPAHADEPVPTAGDPVTIETPTTAAEDNDSFYTVEFDSAGGSAVEEQKITAGEKAKEPDDPMRDGFAFFGWFTEKDEAFDFNTAINADLKLTAKWIEHAAAVVEEQLVEDLAQENETVTLDEQDELDMLTADRTENSTESEHPDAVTAEHPVEDCTDEDGATPGDNAETTDNTTVDEGNDDAIGAGDDSDPANLDNSDGEGSNNDDGIIGDEPDDNYTVYTVTFEVDSGSGIAAQQVKDGETAHEPKAPIKEGFTFSGWYQDDAFTVLFDFDTPITADVTICARWTENEAEKPAFEDSKTANGVRITVTAPEGVFPKDVYLSVESVPVYAQSMVDEAVENERNSNANVAVSYTFDIKVLDKDGNEVQPADEQSVNVSFALAEARDDNLDVQVYHISDEGKAKALDTGTNGGTVTAVTDGFSYYTVEFTYDNLTYVLPGGGEVRLAEILSEVGLTGEVTNAKSSNDGLFSVSNAGGEWIVTSHKPFSTNEILFVTINGVTYEILVTDTNVSGTIYTSSLADNAELVISGDTTIIVDVDKTLKSIKGDYALTIRGDKRLTINSGGHGISVSSVTFSGAIVEVNSKKDGLNIDGNIEFVSGFINIEAGKDGIYSRNGNITISGGTVTSHCGTNCGAIVANNGTIIISAGDVTASGAKYGIISHNGSISLDGTVTARASGWAIWAKNHISVNGGKTAVKGSVAMRAGGAITIGGDSEVEVTATYNETTAISAGHNIVISSGTVTASCKTNGTAIRSSGGGIFVYGGTVTAKGAKYGIIAEEGSVTLNGDVTATASGWAIWAKNDITINGSTEAIGGCAIAAGGSIAINADVKATSRIEGAPAIAANQNITINGGTITADCTTNGTAIKSYHGDIVVNAGNVTALGTKEGIAAKEGSITLSGTVTASGFWAVWAMNDINITGGVIKAKGNIYGLVASTGSVTISGNVVAEGQGSYGNGGIFAGQDVIIKGGPVIAIGSEKAVFAKNGTITIQSPLVITTPSDGRVSGKTIITSSNEVAKSVVIQAQSITGTAQILGTETYVGEALQFQTSGVPSPYQIQWQRSSDNATWSDVSGGSGNTYTSKPGDANYYFRAKVTATGYGGEIYSNVRLVKPLPALTGTIAYTSAVQAGVPVTTQLTHSLQTIYLTAPEKVHFQWQTSNNGTNGWTSIPGATSKPYTPTGADVGKFIRLAATVDGYTGSVISAAREVGKQSNDGDPVTPILSIASPYTSVTVTNSKANQEYVVAYSPGTPGWSGATYPTSDGTLVLPCDSNRTVYVYTRLRETDTTSVGTKIVYNKIYTGHVTYLADLVLDRTTVITKVGEVTALTVSPLPEDFSGWNGDYTVTWFVNGTGVELFSDAACSIPVTQHAPRSYKTVYVKAISQTAFVEVGVEKQVGYTDVRTAFCSFKVADSEGNFVLESISFDDVAMYPGETVISSYTTKPTPASVGTLSFEKSSGPSSNLTLTASGDGTLTVTAPANAEPGTYYYRLKIDGGYPSFISAVKITVLPTTAAVTLDASNGLSQTITQTVDIGSEFILPELPDDFTIPSTFEFGGWDEGAVGEGIIITEDITIRANWIEHVHHLSFVPANDPTCERDGNAAYYYCEDCGKMFEDASGSIKAPTIDYFTIPATGHTPGTAVKEYETAATCDTDGGYDEAVYCTVCGKELSRTHTIIPATGHSLTLISAKEATCTEDGNKAYYECTVCGKWFEDAAGITEIVDYHDVMIDALGHDWGEWVVTKPPTNTEEGEETRTCNRCGEKETRSIAKLDVASYTITVNAGAHGSASASAGTAEEGTTITVTAAPYSGYEIDKITYTPEGGTAMDITSSKCFTMPAANVIVNVTFKESSIAPPVPAVYTVTFDTNGHGTAPAVQTVEDGKMATKPTDLTASGWKFDGWYKEKDCKNAFDFSMPITANITLYAKWTKDGSDSVPVTNYTITYILNGGTLDGKTGTVTVQVEDGAVITLPKPTRSGYTFDYWKGSRFEAGTSYTVTDDHTFTAKWKANTTGNGGKGSSPKTGDYNNMGLWIALMVASLIGIGGMTVCGKIRKRRMNR